MPRPTRKFWIILSSPIIMLMGIFLFLTLVPKEKNWMKFPYSANTMFSYHAIGTSTGRTYGDVRMFKALNHSVEKLQKDHKDIRIGYLDISWKRKGILVPHLSHDKGIDIDILYFGTQPDGSKYPTKPVYSFFGGYLKDYDKNGQCGKLTFDYAMNWKFVRSLRNNPHLKIKKIFVEPYIEEWLIKEAKRQGESPETIAWARNILRFAGKKAADHKDHFHLRFESK